MDQVVKALKPEEIEAIQAKQAKGAAKAKQIAPADFQSEKSIALAVPVEFEGRTFETINLRRLKGKDFLALQRMEGDEDMGLLALISDAPAEVLAELDADDFMTLSEAAKDFLPRRLREAAELISGSGPNMPA